MLTSLPTARLVALCGAPESGKSTVQEILQKHYGYVAVDDGKPLREATKDLYHLTDWHVYTQEGKRTRIDVAGEEVEVRELIGEVGCDVERRHGENFIPWRALKEVNLMQDSEKKRFVFGSVRRNQAAVYKERGGICIEVRRPGKKPRYHFDHYNASLADFRLDNGDFAGDDLDNGTAITLEEFEERIHALFQRILSPAPLIAA